MDIYLWKFSLNSIFPAQSHTMNFLLHVWPWLDYVVTGGWHSRWVFQPLWPTWGAWCFPPRWAEAGGAPSWEGLQGACVTFDIDSLRGLGIDEVSPCVCRVCMFVSVLCMYMCVLAPVLVSCSFLEIIPMVFSVTLLEYFLWRSKTEWDSFQFHLCM